MKREDMTCSHCRFKFEHEDYPGLRCTRKAPTGIVLDGDFKDNVWVGMRVPRQFYCGEGEWLEEEKIELKGADYVKIKLYRFGDVYRYESMYISSIKGE